MLYDVLIIGGGVIGSAIARQLSRYQLTIGVAEKNLDVCCETSGRNSGVVHGGFAYDTGTLKARLCIAGNRMMDILSDELGFAFKRCGKLLVGTTDEDFHTLQQMIDQGSANGVDGLELLSEEDMHRLVPKAIGRFAMFSPHSGIIDPFEFTIALAENAAMNGVKYHFGCEVTDITYKNGMYCVTTTAGVIDARWIINSAGLGCGKISDMLGINGYHVVGSKGDYIILDKRVGKDLPMPVYPVPSNTYMGIHITNTIDGNVIVGPNAISVDDFSYYGVPQSSMDYLADNARKIWPCIFKQDYIRNYSGILPKWIDQNGIIQDFRIEIRPEIAPHAVNLIGIESPGLTAAVPIANWVIEMMKEYETFQENPHFNPIRRGIARFDRQTDDMKAALIREDPNYGEIVCRCEKVTKAELLKAIHNPLGVHTIVGIKYRTRTMMGRCQGGYCQMRLAQLLQEELHLAAEEVVYSKPESHLFVGTLRKEGF